MTMGGHLEDPVRLDPDRAENAKRVPGQALIPFDSMENPVHTGNQPDKASGPAQRGEEPNAEADRRTEGE